MEQRQHLRIAKPDSKWHSFANLFAHRIVDAGDSWQLYDERENFIGNVWKDKAELWPAFDDKPLVIERVPADGTGASLDASPEVKTA